MSPVVVVLETGERDDVASEGFVDVGTGNWSASAACGPMRSFLPLDGVFQRNALLQNARIDATEGERADEGIVHDLEGQHGNRLVVGRLADNLLLGLGIDAVDGENVHRRRQEVDHTMKKRLHALVLEGRTAEHRGTS